MDFVFQKGAVRLRCLHHQFNLINFDIDDFGFFSSTCINALALIPNESLLPNMLARSATIELDGDYLVDGYVANINLLGRSHHADFNLVEVRILGALRFFGHAILQETYATQALGELIKKILRKIELPQKHYSVKSIAATSSLIARGETAFTTLIDLASQHRLYLLSHYTGASEKLIISDEISQLLDNSLIELNHVAEFTSHAELSGNNYCEAVVKNRVFYPGQQVQYRQETFIIERVKMSGKTEVNLGCDGGLVAHGFITRLKLVKTVLPLIQKQPSKPSFNTALVQSDGYDGCDDGDYLISYDFAKQKKDAHQLATQGKSFSSPEGSATFKLKPKTKVLVLLSNTTSRQSVILGTLPSNHWYQSIKTRGAYQLTSYGEASLVFNDETEEVCLSNPSQKQRLVLAKTSVLLESLASDILWQGGQELSLSAEQSFKCRAVRIHFKVQKVTTVDVKTLTIATKGSSLFEGQQRIDIDVKRGRIEATKTLSYEAHHLMVKSAELRLSGQFAWTAPEMNVRCDSLSMSVAGSHLTLNSSGLTITTTASHIKGALSVLKV